MTWGDRVRGVFRRTRTFDAQPRAVFSDPVFPIDQLLLYAQHRVGAIDRTKALKVAAVLRGRNLICSIGTLPLQLVDGSNRIISSELFDQFDPNIANEVMLAMTAEDLLFDSIAWWKVTRFGPDGMPAAAQRYAPGTVSLQPPPDYRAGRLPSGEAYEGQVWMDGIPVRPERVIRFDSPNPPFLVAAEDLIRRELALDQAADLYASSPKMRGFFTPADPNVDPGDDEAIIAALDAFATARRDRLDGYVPASLKYNTVQDPTPAELQLLGLQQRADLNIANALGLDPEDLGINTTSRTYQNDTDRRQDRINDTYAPYMSAIASRLSMNDVTSPGQKARWWLDDYLKADPLTRAQVAQIFIPLGVTDAAEVRQDVEGLPPRQITPPTPPAAPVSRETSPPVSRETSSALAAVPVATFAREPALTFDYEPDARFAVDTGARTITGLAVPWGATAKSMGRKYRFARGTIKWSAVNRVKLLRDHVNSSAIGKAIHLEDTDQGLVATFKVTAGTAGDEALALAADEVLDGLSIGVDFRDEDVTPDPLNPGAYLVSQSALREVSLTAVPSFDDSRLTSVQASRDGSSSMDTCPTCGAQITPGVEHTCPTPATPAAVNVNAPVTFSAEQFATFMAAFPFGAIPPAAAPTATPAGRPTVNPTAHPAPGPVQVAEPLPYRFSYEGGRHRFASGADHDFSSDIMSIAQAAAEHRDPGDALARVNGMISQTFAVSHAVSDVRARATFSNVSTADVTDSTVPHRYRPDMWQAQMDFVTPLYDMVAAGDTDGTKFDIPKFNSSSGLVGPATPGTEPAGGAYTATLQTITPTQVWGKVEIQRQAWRLGGSPQLSGILWDQMLREYYEDRESSIATFLNTLTAAADITVTATPASSPDNDDDQASAQSLEAAIALLQFVRGGNRFRAFAVHQNLYRLLARVTDDSGRPLYPMINPQNANGTTESLYASLNIGGTRAVPSWALGADSGVAPANSWLFDPAKVLAWSSAPERLFWDFGATVQTLNIPQLSFVTMGIYGDVAVGNTDIAGVRQVIYDPSV
jgi:HK97 family phage prohead protease